MGTRRLPSIVTFALILPALLQMTSPSPSSTTALRSSTPKTVQTSTGRNVESPRPRSHADPIVYKSYRQQLGLHDADDAHIKVNGPYSNWLWPQSNHYNIDEKIAILDHTAGASFFWAHQFGFDGGDGGYLGLQDGSSPNGGKIALYSVWQANAASGPNCGTFSGEGKGYTCRIDPYNWVENRTYRLRVQAADVDEYGKWYSAWVQDVSGEDDSYIGRIRVPLAWGGLHGSSSWTEYFGPALSSCTALPRSRVLWHYPTADDGAVGISGHNHYIGPGDCPSYTHIVERGYADVQEVGYPR